MSLTLSRTELSSTYTVIDTGWKGYHKQKLSLTWFSSIINATWTVIDINLNEMTTCHWQIDWNKSITNTKLCHWHWVEQSSKTKRHWQQTHANTCKHMQTHASTCKHMQTPRNMRSTAGHHQPWDSHWSLRLWKGVPHSAFGRIRGSEGSSSKSIRSSKAVYDGEEDEFKYSDTDNNQLSQRRVWKSQWHWWV